MNSKDRVAIITGATGGLGGAVTQALLKAQTKVAVTYTKESALDSLKAQVGAANENWLAVKTNVLQESSVQSMVEQVIDKFGRIDILINLVGGFLGGISIADSTEAQWDNMMNLNLKSVFLCCKNILPIMIRQNSGRIVNVGSKGGIKGTAGMSAYSVSKAGVINFTQALADEGREHNVTANVVIPSIIDTPANRKAMPNADHSKWVTPQALADVILFLCSEGAKDLSGAVIPVYGKS
jgi:NAD(P)-dependent dehydrogenase (short-subunit alcohol dehydrogenase family)